MIAALLLSAALAAEPLAARDALIRDATEWLLNGEDLPRDIDERLMRLPPADRVEVLVFLRRSGMMLGPGWSADRLLAPAKNGETAQ
ncbi:hypothetical protein SAMN04488021_10597 [Paracoccus aminovorans]|uniref:Uncharacterized protein n=1 Tax=Paracoccus aminovorans TaxID=34004 RepID=A0A1I2YS45_9RHOB|nr:hypothetical protein [Paracoccus aminovorans]CQR87423.1 hypothetical protein JCM7685_2883 [Paracoccus aminovorans]SFH27916.1 hypothetical protein SAMN04488021_10597 [Paracoccus aminovorans]